MKIFELFGTVALAGAEKVNKAVEGLGKKAEILGAKLEKIGDNTEKLGRDLTSGISTPLMALGAIFGLNTKEAANFEEQMLKVRAITQASQEDYEKLSKKARELGASTKFSAQEAGEGMESLGSAGWNTGQIMDGITPILELAEATTTDLGVTADIVSGNIAAFGLQASETGRVTDVLANAANISKVNVVSLGESLKYSAPMANALGMSIEETTAMIGIFANSNIGASQAGTTMNAVLRDLTKLMSKESAPEFERLGIKIFDAQGKMKPMSEIINLIANATKNMTDEQKSNLLQSGFQTESLLGLNVLLKQGGDVIEDYTEKLNNSTGAVKSMREIIKQGLNYQLIAFKSAVSEVSIKMGEALLPIMKDHVIPVMYSMLGAVEKLVNWFSGLSQETQIAILKWGAFFALLGPGLVAIGGLISGVGSLLTTFGKLTGVFSKVFSIFKAMRTAVMLAGASSGVAAGIATAAILGIVYVGSVLVRSWQSVLKIMLGIADLIGKAFKVLKLTVELAFGLMVAAVINYVNMIFKFLKPLEYIPGEIGENFKKMSSAIGTYADNSKNYLKSVGGEIASTTKSMGKSFVEIGSGIGGIFKTIGNDLKGAYNFISGFVGKVAGVGKTVDVVGKTVDVVEEKTNNLINTQEYLDDSIKKNTIVTTKNIATKDEAIKSLNNIKSALDNAKKEYDKLSKSGKANAETLEKAKAKVNELENKYSLAQMTLAGFSNSVDKNTDSKDKNSKSTEKLSKAQIELNKKMEEATKVFETQNAINASTLESFEEKSKQYEQDIAFLSENKELNKEYIDTLTEEKKKIDEIIISLKNKTMANDLSLDSLKKGKSPIDEAIQNLSIMKGALENEISLLEKHGIVSGSQVDILKKQKEILDGEIISLGKKRYVTTDLIKLYTQGKKSNKELVEAYEKERDIVNLTNETLNKNGEVRSDIMQKAIDNLNLQNDIKKVSEDIIKSYEAENKINTDTVNGFKDKRKVLEESLEVLEKDKEKNLDKIKLINEEIRAIDKSILATENQTKANELMIKGLEKGTTPVEETISLLKEKTLLIDKQLESLEKQGVTTGNTVDGLNKEKIALETNIKALEGKSDATKNIVTSLAKGEISLETAIDLFKKEGLSIEEVTNAINQYKENIENLPEPKLTWQSQLENFWNKFLNSGSKVGNFLKSFQDKFKKTMEDIQKFTDKNPLIVKVAKMTSGAIGKVAKEIGDTMQGILDTVLGKMNFGNVFQSLFKGDIAGTFKNLFGGIIGKSEEQTKTQLATIEEQRKAELEKVEEGNQAEIDAINARYDLLKAQAENSGFSGLMKRFNDSFEKVITKLMPVFDSLFIALDPMIEPMTQILQILALMLIEILEPMTPLLIKLMEIVGELLQALFPVIEPLMELAVVIIDLVLGVIRPFIPVLRIVAELFGALIRVLKPIFEPFAKLFDAISPLIEPFTKLAELVGLLIKPIEWIVDMFSKITGGVGNVVSGVGGFIGDAVGGVVDFVGGVIGGIGDFFGFANGGLVTGPTNALIGEAGYPEAVIPLKSDVLSYLGQQIAMATPSNGNLNTNSMFDDFEVSRGNGGDIIINLNGDNLVIDDISLQRFARQLFPKLEAERKRRGE